MVMSGLLVVYLIVLVAALLAVCAGYLRQRTEDEEPSFVKLDEEKEGTRSGSGGLL